LFGAPVLLVAGSALGAVAVVAGVVGVVFFVAGGVGALVEAATNTFVVFWSAPRNTSSGPLALNVTCATKGIA